MQFRLSAVSAPKFMVPGLIGLVFCTASAVRAQTITTVYSNVTTFSGQGYAAGGSAVDATDPTTTSLTIADDINLADGATGTINSFTFSVANFNATDTLARPILSFYDMDPTTGAPTTLLFEAVFNPITFTAGTVNTFTYSSGSSTPLFTTGGSFWAAETFDNGGTASATTATALDSLGVGLFDPPTVGSSQDVFFQSTNTGPGVYGGNSPAGSFFYFGGTPVANFGFQFTGGTSLPEPTALALALAGGTAIVALTKRYRR